jgi:hypothetical protein
VRAVLGASVLLIASVARADDPTQERAPAASEESATTSHWPAAQEQDPAVDATGMVVSPAEPEIAPPDEPLLVTVEGDKAPAGASSLGRREIREMPGVLGDPYRAIEVEPGVTPLASGVPFYFIRGAPPGNIGYFFDGISIPMLFHAGAGPGIIPPSLVSRVELHMGPYPARFGRLAGAIVDAEAAPDRVGGARSAPGESDLRAEGVFRTVDLGGLIEGPLPAGAGSFLAGGHYSVGTAILSALVPSIDIEYGDYQARTVFKTGTDSKLSVLAFGSYDYLATVDGEVRDVLIDSDFHRLDLRYEEQLRGGGSVRASTTLGLDRSRGIGVESATNLKLLSRATILRPLSERLLLRAGLDLALDGYDVVHGGVQDCTTFVCSGGLLGASTEAELAEAFQVLFPSRVDLALGGFVDALIVLGDRATITPGLRVDYLHSRGQSDVAVDPKLVGRFGVTDAFRLVPAVGLASQLPGFPPLPGLQIGGSREGSSGRCRRASARRVRPGPSTFGGACSVRRRST